MSLSPPRSETSWIFWPCPRTGDRQAWEAVKGKIHPGDIISTAQRLRLGKTKILERWEQRVQNELGPVVAYAPGQLRNSLAEVFDVLVAVLTDPDPQNAFRAKEDLLAIGHGKIRAEDPCYSLERVTDEYLILQQVLFEVLEFDHKTGGSCKELKIIQRDRVSRRGKAF
jgi:hypothetical protein